MKQIEPGKRYDICFMSGCGNPASFEDEDEIAPEDRFIAMRVQMKILACDQHLVAVFGEAKVSEYFGERKTHA